MSKTCIHGITPKCLCGICDKEYRKEQHKKWYQRHKEHVTEKKKEWRERNKQHIKDYNGKYHEEHMELYRRQMRKWCREHREKHNNSVKKWRCEHIEQRREYDRKRRQEHKEIIIAQRKAYYCIPLASKCLRCGSVEKLERHHFDYSKPLDVVTLCRPCHALIHTYYR